MSTIEHAKRDRQPLLQHHVVKTHAVIDMCPPRRARVVVCLHGLHMPHPRVGHPCIVGSFRGDVVREAKATAGRRGAGVGALAIVISAFALVAAGCTASHPSTTSSGSVASPPTASPSVPPSAASASAPSTASSASPVLPIRYLVAPHPDDEFALWSMAQDPSHFPVLLVLTHGEKAAACGGAGLQAAAGERIPSPPPSASQSPSTATCSAERIDSLLAFLTNVGSLDP